MTTDYKLKCVYCHTNLCSKASKSYLISDKRISVYSTIEAYNIYLHKKFYTSSVCNCKIKELSCSCCNNSVGYNVVAPCSYCLESKHNGHLVMFHTGNVIPFESRNFEHFEEKMAEKEIIFR